MSRPGGLVPAEKVNNAHKLALPTYIQKKYLEKLQKHLWRGLICESSWIKDHSLLRCFARNLAKVIFALLKDK